MEESFEELYQQFLEVRKKKIKELIEVQEQLSIAEEISNIKRSQECLMNHLESTDSGIVASKLSSEMRANTNFFMDVMGLGKDQLTSINQNQNMTVLPASPTAGNNNKLLGVIESVNFEDA